MTEDGVLGNPPEREQDQARRGGRRQGASTTRDDILRAARKLFSERGYRGATTRAIAQEARVDSALVHYFFDTKERLFTAAVRDALDPSVVLDAVRAQSEGTTGERLIRAFLSLWDDPEAREPALAVVRSSIAHDSAGWRVNDLFTTQVVGEVMKTHARDQAEKRTVLIGTLLFGILEVRYLLRMEPLASMAPKQVAALLAPAIDRLITGDLDGTETGPDAG